ncbi:SF1B family DNA helicase RecD2 [Lactococcus lactis]|uniref:SF1B family DNA helicase RecD2 n=1 Tax=Lactococcus lactis TaxID=1358 RepID=UPI0021A44DBF|nr:ATP-dependent RecD-like DNA helicase [Lactococcus lactis]MCT3133345.1 ATP-dependent RecD-like DNA helicase [Lactococcus lactis]MDT2850649.1 ATP-dependent RecD-like DNA helicase [Lactococcus lactis]
MIEKTYFTGSIEAIFFSNPSNFYKVLLIEIDETNAEYDDFEIVVNGTIGDVVEGDSYTFYGQLTQHPKYGEQLQVSQYEKAVPTSGAGLVKYFSSDKFPGIGKKTAEKIVETFPENTVDSILEAPEKLDGLLTLARKNSFIKRLRENHGMEKVLTKLAEYGLPSKITFQIYELYKEETIEKIEENPYQLVEDVKGVGFKTADKIASSLGIEADSPNRFRAALMHEVNTHSQSTGDTYIEAKNLLEMTIDLLEEARNVEVNPSAVAEEINGLIVDGKVQQEGTKIFENSLYFAEDGIRKSLTALTNRSGKDFADEKLLTVLAEVEKDLEITYDDLQKQAIIGAMNQQFFILTGGPGTGKTTIINGFIETYARLHQLDLDPDHYNDDIFPILLAAPTGRASRRMNELTGLPAATIHRHLGLGQDEAEDALGNELSGALLIVDEFSMVDTWLANKLFQAIPGSMKVLLVGDADQLPSVGPGQIFADLLKIPEIPSVKLDKIFRQGDDSTITDLAHHIKDGQLPSDFTAKKPDRSYFEVSANFVPQMVEQIASAWKKRGNNPFELQILAPMYKGMAGINAMNVLLQNLFNPLNDRLEFALGDMKFREGDKVLHLVNDAEANVFNGDLGQIVELIAAKYTDSKQDELVMDFDGQELTYPRAEWYKITLAYAMSIHKSQGSEFSTVIVPMVSSYSRMLERNLLYTAITRAKQSLILLGEERAFAQAVAREGSNRKTYLIERFMGENPAAKNLSVEIVSEKVTDKKERSNKEKKLATPVELQGQNHSVSKKMPAKVEEISLFEDEEIETLDQGSLTEALILSGNFDPLIGLTQQDFAIFNK